MSSAAERILQEVTALSDEERMEVAYEILATVDPEAQEEISAAWKTELKRRAIEIDAGRMPGRPASEVFAELRAKFA